MTMEIDALYAGQPIHNSLDPCSNCAEQAKRIRMLLQALQDITDPIGKMRRNLQEGYTLNGAACVHMANDPDTYRRMAREALEADGTKTKAAGEISLTSRQE